MIIKAKPLPRYLLKTFGALCGMVFRLRCHKLDIKPVDLKPNHSYLLMCNHFSFWDGFWAFYVFRRTFLKQHNMKKLYIMSLKKQMEKNPWLRYIGSFSIDPGKRSIEESFEYAAEILSEPGNLLLFYPQGKLESCYIRYIKFDEGLYEIVPKIKGDCQLIWSSTIVEYFESLNPSIFTTMLDCGTNHGFDFEGLKKIVNAYHLQSIQRNIRYTDEPITYNF